MAGNSLLIIGVLLWWVTIPTHAAVWRFHSEWVALIILLFDPLPPFSFFLSAPSTDFIPCTMCSQNVSRLARWYYDRLHTTHLLGWGTVESEKSFPVDFLACVIVKIMTWGVWLCVVPSVICAPSANGTLYGKNICIKLCFKLYKTINETFHVPTKQNISLSVY